MSTDGESVAVSLPPEVLDQLDALVAEGGFDSRSAALQHGARLVISVSDRSEAVSQGVREDVRERLERKRVS